MSGDLELRRLRDEFARRDAELVAARREIADLFTEMEETNRGLIALHAELDQARRAEAQLAAIVQSSDDAMYSFTLDHLVRTWNAGAERLLGYRASEIVGRSIDTLVPDELAEEFDATMKRLAAGGPAQACDTRRRRKDGSLVDVGVTMSAIRDSDGNLVGLSAVVRDITAHLRAEEELAATRAEREVYAEQERIARDLHDHVIQRVFAAGLALQAAAGMAERPELKERLQRTVDDLDATIADIRTTIFGIQRHAGVAEPGLRTKILQIVDDAKPALGFAPAVRFHGPVDTAVSAAVAGHASAVVREALSNVARHAHASAAVLTVTAADELVLEIEDNGRGIGEPTRQSGLGNLRNRATALRGTFEVATSDGGGTRLAWRVPLTD